jgi:hypothetical protein
MLETHFGFGFHNGSPVGDSLSAARVGPVVVVSRDGGETFQIRPHKFRTFKAYGRCPHGEGASAYCLVHWARERISSGLMPPRTPPAPPTASHVYPICNARSTFEKPNATLQHTKKIDETLEANI